MKNAFLILAFGKDCQVDKECGRVGGVGGFSIERNEKTKDLKLNLKHIT